MSHITNVSNNNSYAAFPSLLFNLKYVSAELKVFGELICSYTVVEVFVPLKCRHSKLFSFFITSIEISSIESRAIMTLIYLDQNLIEHG